MSAVRNLNGVRIDGKTLSVEYEGAPTRRGDTETTGMMRGHVHQDAIDIVNRAPLHELWEYMADFNTIPEKDVREMLTSDPRLAHAVLQAQFRLGVIPPSAVPDQPVGPPQP